MELREYIRIISKHAKVFWASIIIVTLAALIFSFAQPHAYLASTTITVNKASALKQSQVDYYLFDNYYNVQSSGLFSQIVTSWFSSPAMIKEIYDKAGLTLPPVSQNKLAKIFKAVRIEPATIHVSLTGSNRDELEKLITAASDVMQEKANELGKSDKENIYDIVKFSPIVTDSSQNIVLNTIIGIIIGFLLGIILSLGVDYFGRSSERK